MSDTKISEARILLAEAFGCDPEELLDGEVRAVRAVLALQSVKPRPAELAEQQEVDAHTLWAMAQLAPGEGIEEGVRRIEKALAATGKQQAGEVQGDALAPLSFDQVAAMAPAGLTWDETGAWGMGYEACRKAALAARQPGAQVPVCSGGFVIGNGSGEKYMAWGQVGPEWVADRSAALWLVRRADAEALAAENEDAWLILPVERCALPPNGWACTLASGHDGPCPTIAAPPAQGIDLHRLVPPEWLSEQLGGLIDDLTPGQAWRQGFNQCRARALLLVEQAMGFPSEQQRDAAPGVGNG